MRPCAPSLPPRPQLPAPSSGSQVAGQGHAGYEFSSRFGLASSCLPGGFSALSVNSALVLLSTCQHSAGDGSSPSAAQASPGCGAWSWKHHWAGWGAPCDPPPGLLPLPAPVHSLAC